MRCKRPHALALVLTALSSLSPLQAVVLLLDPGGDADTANNTTVYASSAAGPYATTGTDRWNKGDLTTYGNGGTLVYSDGTTAAGVSVVSDALSTATYNFTASNLNSVGNAGAGGVYGTVYPGRDSIYGGNQGTYGGIATRVSGLAQGTYDIYVVGAYTGANSGPRPGAASPAQQAVWVFGGANATTLTTNSGALVAGNMNENLENSTAASWSLNNNYALVRVTLDATNTDLYIVTEGSANDSRRGWQSVIQIVSVPEPTVAGLAGMGMLALGTRRRRRSKLC